METEPEQVLVEMMERVEQLENQLVNAGPTMEQNRKISTHLETVIKISAIQLHQIFHQLKVPNAIHSKIRFPDGLYEIKFTRMSTPKYN